MRVAAHDGVNTTHTAGHFQVHIHAVVADDHHHLSALATGFFHHLLHVFVLDAKRPIGHHVTWVGNRGVGEGLANDGTWHTVDFTDHIRFEDRVAKVIGLDVLRHKIHFASKIFFNDFFHALHAQREFPMTCHDVDAQQFASIDHVLSVGPQTGARTLPGVTAIEQQGAWAAGFHALDQGCQVRKSTHFAVALGCFLIVQIRQGMGFGSTRTDLGSFQQILAHQMWQIALHRTNAHVDAGLTEINRLELSVAIGHVQERHIAKLRNVIQPVCRRGRAGFGKRAHAQACHRAGTHHLNKFAFGEIHICNH